MDPTSAKLKMEESPSPSNIFYWSPLPPRKELGIKKPESLGDDLQGKRAYPNCDGSIWLRSCEQEIVEPIDGEIKGEIPTWLNGSLLRNGPGSTKAGTDEFQHLFDCSALLHRFGIKMGKVTYQCRFLQSEVYKKICAAKRLVVTEFGTRAVPDPCQSIFQRVATVFDFSSDISDNAMISIYPFDDEIYAFNEIPIIHKVNPTTLETEGQVNVNNYVNIVNHTSHPHVTHDGVYNLGMSVYASGPYHSIVYFPKNTSDANKESMFAKTKLVASVPARWPLNPCYMHTFGITPSYYIIVEQPLCIYLPELITQKIKKEPMAGCLKWYSDEYTQFSVLSRHTGKLAYTFFADAFFYLHIINQYEEKDHIVVDICVYRDPSMIECMYIESIKTMQYNTNYAKMFRGRPVRFVLPLKPEAYDEVGSCNLIKLDGTEAKAYYVDRGRKILVKGERLCDLGCETPRISYERFLDAFLLYR
ncbi:carotenoid isomerooxygenase isoform X2 [Cylas formicarius]|uniref:carotenoid isomerooxygenase isoform X2 n=1 Tax=Cylas formicarius TaxID=197179 RepID=UPI002958B4A6|nr:carotenoid isomerooxygenase isoform X2 [Cylas formicarius]